MDDFFFHIIVFIAEDFCPSTVEALCLSGAKCLNWFWVGYVASVKRNKYVFSCVYVFGICGHPSFSPPLSLHRKTVEALCLSFCVHEGTMGVSCSPLQF